ncbi:efflux RND transporter periplasmic adaptor subunit [Aquicella lusitana]|uniref:Multidrug efflux pump subunit AcrA (Membrane-fusion protein) n=1 Tax=Aquicella lusitana TaxID=254246 RepID=A0A370GSB7_9COXI|nr:efflux RND transporter periplasmic adaptor subunit [Aquicella lusitana]RDI46592.1 multidrug efflux pump subunit AcrA (membrane-fusion protein) [Aquicella lusitana]VVC74256.1 Macrolide export protein MacA [Aquicella lusitana]
MKNQSHLFYLPLIVLTVLCLLSACSREPKVEGGRVVTIEARSFANTLYYSGTIQPLKTLVVPCPTDGVVVDMPFQYGEKVKPGQLLFLISSSKFLSDYKSALMQYIKAKSDFNNSQGMLSEAEFLHKNELISDDDYKMKKSTFYANRLALLQAKDALENLLKQLDIKDINLYKLTIADIDKITEAMHLRMSSENLRIFSPAEGTVLSPSKTEEENKKISKGDAVKQGDVLAVIGDMNGLSVHIKVNELTVNQLRIGQKVKVTGIAFPDEILKGEIKRVDKQGEATNGGLPTFSVEITVPTLTAAQQKMIHVGMSAKVEINIEEAPQIMIPFAALSEKNGATYIRRYDTKTGKTPWVEVKTGKATADTVAILSGLKAGDKIVIPG